MKIDRIMLACFKAAVYAAAVVFLANKIGGCIVGYEIDNHNCAVKWARRRAELGKTYQTNVVVRTSKISDDKTYYDFNGTELLLYKNADMKYGPGGYVLEYAEYEPCPLHGGSPRIFYSVSPAGGGSSK